MRGHVRPHCIPLFLVLVCLTFTGCLSWKPSWNEAGPSSSSDIAATLLDEARDLTRDADSAEKLQAAIDAYEHVLEASFADYEALTAVADHSILMATAYTPGRHGKRELFARAMRYSEQAMYRNLEFKALVDQGETPWDASRVLASEELDACRLGSRPCCTTLRRAWVQWPGWPTSAGSSAWNRS